MFRHISPLWRAGVPLSTPAAASATAADPTMPRIDGPVGRPTAPSSAIRVMTLRVRFVSRSRAKTLNGYCGGSAPIRPVTALRPSPSTEPTSLPAEPSL